MALPVQQFRPLNPEEINPFGNLLKNSLERFRDITNTSYLPDEKKQALQKTIYENLIKQAEAKYADPMQEAKLAYERETAPHLHAQTGLLGQQSKYYGPNILSEIANREANTNRANSLAPLEEALKKVELKYAPDSAKASIASQLAMANMRNIGSAGMGVGGKDELMFQNLVAKDNPQLRTSSQIYEASNVLRSGGDSLSDGTKLNPISPAAQSTLNRIIKGGTTSQLYNQSANLDDLVAQLEDLDINPALKFTGLKGALNYKANQSKAALGLPVSQEFVDYEGYKNTTIANMDSMRKALGTTVQPKYVKEFLGQLTNPNSSIWSNPESVKTKYDATLKWVRDHAANIRNKVISAPYGSNKSSRSGNFDLSKMSDEELMRIAGGIA